MGSRPWHLKVM